jgi:hypothetical protein
MLMLVAMTYNVRRLSSISSSVILNLGATGLPDLLRGVGSCYRQLPPQSEHGRGCGALGSHLWQGHGLPLNVVKFLACSVSTSCNSMLLAEFLSSSFTSYRVCHEAALNVRIIASPNDDSSYMNDIKGYQLSEPGMCPCHRVYR